MTPQFASQSSVAPWVFQQGPHLTEDQFGELFLSHGDGRSTAAEAHLLVCEQCAAELASLRESLSLFRQASSAHAESELRRLPQPVVWQRVVPFFEPMYILAAAALFLAALLPMQALRHYALQPAPVVATVAASQPAESDEALLDDVSREVSLSVPVSMQALADPSADDTAVQTSTQRKD